MVSINPENANYCLRNNSDASWVNGSQAAEFKASLVARDSVVNRIDGCASILGRAIFLVLTGAGFLYYVAHYGLGSALLHATFSP